MPEVCRSDGEVLVSFGSDPADRDVLNRVRGWEHWQEARLTLVRAEDGEGWETRVIEMVAPIRMQAVVDEIITGEIPPETAHTRGRRPAWAQP
jgi:hypothetical protein